MASPTWWIWVWVGSGCWWWTGSLACYNPWGHKELDMTELNWTELNTVDRRYSSLIPRLGRSPGGGHSNPLQYSCLENPTNREAWEAIVHAVTKSWTGLKRLNTHTLWSSLVASFPWWFFFIASLVAQMVKNLSEMQETQIQSLGQEDLLEKGIATYSSILAWRIPWTQEPGRL